MARHVRDQVLKVYVNPPWQMKIQTQHTQCDREAGHNS